MNKQQNSENKKALPKFFAIMLLGALIGLAAGGITGFFGGTLMPDEIIKKIYHIFRSMQPYTIWGVTILFTILEIRCYSNGKKIYEKWDGEDEISIEKAEENLSLVLVLTACNMVLNFFFVGADTVVRAEHNAAYLLTLFGFIAGIGAIIILQQKVIDLTKKINPEKKGSVYDIKFSKKWLDSCDENEQRQIGQAAFKSYTVVSNACVVIWLILFFISDIFQLGIMPIFVVSLIWGILQVTYGYECIRLGRHY